MGNTFGTLFRVSTFGESHGPAVGAVLDGCPPRIPLEAAAIQRQLDRRRPGQSRITTQRQEGDQVEILSGVDDIEAVIDDPGQVTLEQVEANIVRCPDPAVAGQMIERIDAVRKAGDSVGGVVEAVARGVPPGWGEPVFGKLEADLATAMMS